MLSLSSCSCYIAETARTTKSAKGAIGGMGKGSNRAAANNRANQMNPNNYAYASSRASTKATNDNRSGQLNPETDVYWSSRNAPTPMDSDKHETDESEQSSY